MKELPCFSPISLFPSIFVQVHMVKPAYDCLTGIRPIITNNFWSAIEMIFGTLSVFKVKMNSVYFHCTLHMSHMGRVDYILGFEYGRVSISELCPAKMYIISVKWVWTDWPQYNIEKQYWDRIRLLYIIVQFHIKCLVIDHPRKWQKSDFKK